MERFELETPVYGFVEITARIRQIVRESGIEEGLCVVYCPHTTAAITINENADPDVVRDLKLALADIFPDRRDFRHAEGNSAAHLKSAPSAHRRPFPWRAVPWRLAPGRASISASLTVRVIARSACRWWGSSSCALRCRIRVTSIGLFESVSEVLAESGKLKRNVGRPSLAYDSLLYQATLVRACVVAGLSHSRGDIR